MLKKYLIIRLIIVFASVNIVNDYISILNNKVTYYQTYVITNKEIIIE